MTQITSPASATLHTSAHAVRRLLTCGIVAGPLWITVAGIQVLTRDGFDIRRHAISLLGNGDLGWIQIANFIVAGVLIVAGAVGMRRALRAQRGGTWGPMLIGVYGAGQIAAGVLVADPAFGFPAGTPAGPAATMSWHGIGHFAAAGVGFLALIAACFVLARRFSALGQRSWAVYSATVGALFLAAFAGISSGGQIPGINVAFGVAVVLAWAWISALAAHLRAGETTS